MNSSSEKKPHTDKKDCCYKFYNDISNTLYCLFGGLLFLYGFCWILQNGATENDFTVIDKIMCYAGIILSGLGVIVLSLRLLKNEPYIEITPTYIKIENYERLLWEDVGALIISQFSGFEYWFFVVNDYSKYKLTLIQKLTVRMDYLPFGIVPTRLSKQDKRKIKSILKEHTPTYNHHK